MSSKTATTTRSGSASGHRTTLVPEISGWAQAAAGSAATLAVMSLLGGWVFGIGFFVRVTGGLAAMVPSTAVSLLLLSVGCLVQLRHKSSDRPVAAVAFPVAAAAAIAVVNLLVMLTGRATGIDALIFVGATDFGHDSMSIGTALDVLLAAAALVGMAMPRSFDRAPVVIATMGLLVALVCLFGYAFDVASLYAVTLFATMSLPTAIAFALLFIAILLIRPQSGWVGLLGAPGSGSAAARRLLPIVVGTPFLMSLLALKASDAGLFTPNFRLSILCIVTIALLSVFVLHNAAVDNRAERHLLASMAKLDIALADKSLLLHELYHRVKNNLQQINSLIALEGRRAQGKPCEAVLESLSARVRALGAVHETLIRTPQISQVDAGHFLRTLCEDIAKGLDLERRGFLLTVSVPDETIVDIDRAVSIGLLVNELVTNSVKHAFPQRSQGRIAVDLHARPQGSLSMTVSDDGVGIDEARFRAASGSGSKIVFGLVRQLQGEVRIDPVAGTAIVITLPARPDLAGDGP